MNRLYFKLLAVMMLIAASIAPASADTVRAVDPNAAISGPARAAASKEAMATEPGIGPIDTPHAAEAADSAAATMPAGKQTTYRKDDLIGAAEGVFGKGAKGLGEMMEKILKDQGEPNAYIAGREASGAFVVGLRYGSGTLRHNVEGEKPVYWTGPSVGFDVGGDAAKVFVLVYNLYDGDEIYRRYPQVEGRAYFIGGLSATYLRRGNVAIIPIRLGAGVRLGANVGYMRFSRKSRLLPF